MNPITKNPEIKNLVIKPDGKVVGVYDDNVDLKGVGKIDITRASHVEPNQNGDWVADLSPVNGPVLGPFTKRHEALESELNWLNAHLDKI